MKFLKRFWPWKRISELECRVERLQLELLEASKQHKEAIEKLTHAEHHHSQTKKHLDEAIKGHTDAKKNLRRLVTALAIKEGFAAK